LWNYAILLNQLGNRDEAFASGEITFKFLEELEDSNVAKVRAILSRWRGV
jgi:hypothetical protein